LIQHIDSLLHTPTQQFMQIMSVPTLEIADRVRAELVGQRATWQYVLNMPETIARLAKEVAEAEAKEKEPEEKA